MEYHRIIALEPLIKRKSLFLFGPRQTGKTFLLKKRFPAARFYNLLLSDVFFRLSQRPHLLREELMSQTDHVQPIIIDEIQKLPVLLDEVHNLIEEKRLKFILTGSSARKFKRGGANLLAGRAATCHLFPLVSAEIPGYQLLKILNFGSLPFIYNSESPEDDLLSYVGTYLKEEVQAEGMVRRIENFSKFLQLAALVNGELLNFSNVASDMGMPSKTIKEYFLILEDTLIGHFLQPFTRTQKRKAISTAKFYFFDVGVANTLAGRSRIRPKTELFGKALEHFIFLEIKAFLSYRNDKRQISFWRSKSGYEVDFVLGESTGIEVKGTEMVTEKHLAGLKSLAEEIPLKKKIVVSLDSKPRLLENIRVLPVSVFLKELWGGSI
jgi:predicted AAA+ superfamily ATPase